MEFYSLWKLPIAGTYRIQRRTWRTLWFAEQWYGPAAGWGPVSLNKLDFMSLEELQLPADIEDMSEKEIKTCLMETTS